MSSQRAYTLIELIIVIAIIMMVTALGLPAFARYQHLTEFSQKTEEVKELFSLARSMALSPATPSITSYQVHYDSVGSPNKFTVVSCTGNGTCDTPQEVARVSLLSGQSIQVLPTNESSDGQVFSCQTLLVGGKLICAQNPVISTISFLDSNTSVERAADFIVKYDPFMITIVPRDL